MVRQGRAAAQAAGRPSGSAAHAGLGMVVVMTGVLITAVDTTIVVLALPEIERDLHVPLASVIWVIIGYLLVITVLATQVGRLGDMFGRVRMYEAGFLIFVLGSLACALAWNDASIIGFRILQGIGAAFVTANSGAVISDLYPPERRGRAYGYNSIGWSLGAVLGIVLGGAIVTYVSWRWIFWINVPIGIAAVVLATRVLRDRGERARRHLDLVGMVTLGLGLFGVLWAMTKLATSPLDASIAGWLVGGLAFLALFVLAERRQSEPMLDLSLLKIPTMAPSLLAALFQGLANFAVLFLVIMYLQGPRGLSPLHASLLLVPGYLIGSAVGPFAGRLADRVGPVIPATVGLGIQVVALAIYAQLSMSSGLWLVVAGSVVNGIGASAFFPANNSAVMKASPPTMLGVSSGMLRTFANVGMVFSFAVAILTASRAISRSLAFAIFVGTTSLHGHLAAAFTSGLHAAFYTLMVFMILAAVLSAVRGRLAPPGGRPLCRTGRGACPADRCSLAVYLRRRGAGLATPVRFGTKVLAGTRVRPCTRPRAARQSADCTGTEPGTTGGDHRWAAAGADRVASIRRREDFPMSTGTEESAGTSACSAIVNGKTCRLGAPTARSLLAFLRSDLGLTGVKPGCGEGECGACTVLVDGIPMLACQATVGAVAGRSVTTIEGLAANGGLHPVQQALAEQRAWQCGYCTPGMALRAAALLAAEPDPTDDQIAAALQPNICRCCGYQRISRAVHRAAELRGEPGQPAPEPVFTAPAGPVLARPHRPWDLCEPADRDWFGILGDGLVAVWPPAKPPAGMWAANGGAWIHLAPSGAVTAFTGKVDIGQDNQTALRLLVAEELAVPLDRVTLVQGDTDLCPFDVGTFGSRSMPDAGRPLRLAAAGARRVLAGLAARRWGIAADALGADAGTVAGGPGGARLAYGALVAGLRRVEVLGDEPPLTDPAAWRVAGHWGHAVVRLDVVTGARRYGSDLQLPGMLHGAVLRPPSPGCALRAADTSQAAALPGVSVVQEDGFIGITAPDAATARRAVAAIRADWDWPPSGPAGMASYLREHPAAGQGWERPADHSAGDADAALAAAAVTVQATYTTAYLAHVPLETSAALADWDDRGRLTVRAGCNVPFAVRSQLASALGMDEADVRVIVPPTGGGFGGKHGANAIEAARLARAAGRPVRVHWSRAEEFTRGYLRPMAVIDVRAGADPDGSMTGWDFTDINAGAQGTSFPYRCGNWRIRYRPAASPLAQGPYRALAATANTFARESCVDELAHATGTDPLAFRLRHLGDERLADVLRAAAARSDRDCAAGNTRPGRSGWGCAVGLEKDGRVASCAEVSVGPGSEVTVTSIVTAYECGAVVNPDTVTSQVEGGTIMALGGALFEQAGLDHGRLASPLLADYRVPRFGDVPAVEVVLVNRPDIPSAGAGETPLIAVAPAVANAIFAATGRRLRSLPLIPDGRLPPAG